MKLTVNEPLPSILKKTTWWTAVLKAAYLLLEEVPTLPVPRVPVPMISNQKWSISNTTRFEEPHLKWRTGETLGLFWQATIWHHSLERHTDVLAILVLKPLIALQVFFGLNLQTNSVDYLTVDLSPVQKPWILSSSLPRPTHTQIGSPLSAYVDIEDFPNTELSLSLIFTLHRHGQNLVS